MRILPGRDDLSACFFFCELELNEWQCERVYMNIPWIVV